MTYIREGKRRREDDLRYAKERAQKSYWSKKKLQMRKQVRPRRPAHTCWRGQHESLPGSSLWWTRIGEGSSVARTGQAFLVYDGPEGRFARQGLSVSPSRREHVSERQQCRKEGQAFLV